MNLKRPLISVITVSYNVVNTIEQTILSVINQGFDNYEYIIIDGGSQDGTLEIIKKFEDKITIWVSEPDKGIYDAMNKGVLLAKGEWVNFMNAGDLFANNISKLLNEALIDDSHDVIYGDVFIKKNEILSLDKAREIQQLNYSLNFCHQSSFVRREILIKHPFSLNYKISSDYNLFLNLFINGYNFYYIKSAISIFEYGGISSNASKKYIKERFLIISNSHKGISKKIWFGYKFAKMLLPFNRNTVLNFFKK
ncbi:glycosyltransferase family 2 protein [Flavobacterium sp. 3-218]